jgi:hypothetical protein
LIDKNMEIERYNCPNCFTKGVIKTRDNLCPNCKQILTDDNKAFAEESINEQISDNNNMQDDTWDEKLVLSELQCGIITGVTNFLGFIFLILSPIVLLSNPKNGSFIITDTISKYAFYLTISGLIIIEFGLYISKATKAVKIIVGGVIFIFNIFYLFFLGLLYIFSQMFKGFP